LGSSHPLRCSLNWHGTPVQRCERLHQAVVARRQSAAAAGAATGKALRRRRHRSDQTHAIGGALPLVLPEARGDEAQKVRDWQQQLHPVCRRPRPFALQEQCKAATED
jgi:hypothetical protein